MNEGSWIDSTISFPRNRIVVAKYCWARAVPDLDSTIPFLLARECDAGVLLCPLDLLSETVPRDHIGKKLPE